MNTLTQNNNGHYLLVLILIFLLAACSKSDNDGGEIIPQDKTAITDALVKINDQGLKNCINDNIATTNFQFTSDILELNCVGYGILNLSGIDAFSNITKLNLSAGGVPSNSFSTIAPLSDLTKLEILYLDFHQNISNIEALSTLSNIRELRIQNAYLNSIVGLENKPRLEVLDITENNITDLSPLSISSGSETALRRIILANDPCDCNQNTISDLSPLANHINLESITNNAAGVTDISPLENLTKLTNVSLSYNDIVDITPLANLINIVNLDLSNNNIQNVDALSNLTALEVLLLDSNKIATLSNDAQSGFLDTEHPVLQDLYISGNKIRDISDIIKLPALANLDIASNRISILPDDMSLLTALKSFRASDNNIADVTVLGTAANLSHAYLERNSIETGITNLQSLASIINIYLNFNPLLLCSDLNALDAILDSGVTGDPKSSGKVVWNDPCDSGGDVDVAIITDIELKNCFLAAYPIQPVAVSSVQALDCSGPNTQANISSMAGLNQLVHLVDLNLGQHNLANFSNIDHLRRLTSLNLSQDTNTASQDRNMYQFASVLRNLVSLDLSGQRIRNLGGLEALYNLSTLSLEFAELGNGVNNLAEIDSFTAIHTTCARDYFTGTYDLTALFQVVVDTLGSSVVQDSGCA